MTDSSTTAASSPPSRRSWFRPRFSLRTLLIVMTLCGVGMWYVTKVVKRYQAIKMIEEMSIGSSIRFEGFQGNPKSWRKNRLAQAIFDRVSTVYASPQSDRDIAAIADVGSIECLVLWGFDHEIRAEHIAVLVEHCQPRIFRILFKHNCGDDVLPELRNGSRIEKLTIAGGRLTTNDVSAFVNLKKLHTFDFSGEASAEAIAALETLQAKVEFKTKLESREQFEAIMKSTRIHDLRILNPTAEASWFAGTQTNDSISVLTLSGPVLSTLPLERFQRLQSISVFNSAVDFAALENLARSKIPNISLDLVKLAEKDVLQFDWSRLRDRKLSFSDTEFSENSLAHLLSQCTPDSIDIREVPFSFEAFLRIRERFPHVDHYDIPQDWISQLPPRKNQQKNDSQSTITPK